MWGTPEDCTAVVRVMQNFEKLAAPHQGTGTLYDPKARLNFEDNSSPNTSKAFYNAERSPSGSQGNRSYLSTSSLARKSNKDREKDVQLLCAKGRISHLENEANSLQTQRKRARIEQQKEIDVRQGELRRQLEKNSELQRQLKYVVDQEKNVRDELKGTRKEFEDFKKKTEEKVHSLQRQKLKLNAEVEEVSLKWFNWALKIFGGLHLKIFSPPPPPPPPPIEELGIPRGVRSYWAGNSSGVSIF